MHFLVSVYLTNSVDECIQLDWTLNTAVPDKQNTTAIPIFNMLCNCILKVARCHVNWEVLPWKCAKNHILTGKLKTPHDINYGKICLLSLHGIFPHLSNHVMHFAFFPFMFFVAISLTSTRSMGFVSSEARHEITVWIFSDTRFNVIKIHKITS